MQSIFKMMAVEYTMNQRPVKLLQLKNFKALVYCIRNLYCKEVVSETYVRLESQKVLNLGKEIDF